MAKKKKSPIGKLIGGVIFLALVTGAALWAYTHRGVIGGIFRPKEAGGDELGGGGGSSSSDLTPADGDLTGDALRDIQVWGRVDSIYGDTAYRTFTRQDAEGFSIISTHVDSRHLEGENWTTVTPDQYGNIPRPIGGTWDDFNAELLRID